MMASLLSFLAFCGIGMASNSVLLAFVAAFIVFMLAEPFDADFEASSPRKMPIGPFEVYEKRGGNAAFSDVLYDPDEGSVIEELCWRGFMRSNWTEEEIDADLEEIISERRSRKAFDDYYAGRKQISGVAHPAGGAFS